MCRCKIRLAVASATFIIGVVAASLWVVHHRHPTEPPPAPTVSLRPKPNHPDGWKRIDVDGKLSFYLPPDVEQEKEPVGNIEYFGPHKSFGSNTLSVGYVYVEKRHNEELWRGKVSCELLADEPQGVANFQSSELEINGRRARQIFFQWSKPNLLVTRVCFPDVGDGTVFTLSVNAKDQQGLDLAKRMFSSIEFP